MSDTRYRRRGQVLRPHGGARDIPLRDTVTATAVPSVVKMQGHTPRNGARQGLHAPVATPVTAPATDCPLLGLKAIDDIPAAGILKHHGARRGVRCVEPGSLLFSEGDTAPYIFTVCSGWAFSYVVLETGARQVLNIYLPGDVAGFQSFATGNMDHSLEALTPAAFCAFDKALLLHAFHDEAVYYREIAGLLDWERTNLLDQLTSTGRRNSLGNLSFFLLRLFLRLERREMTLGNQTTFPVTQSILADAIGLSPEHVNRLLRELRESGIVSIRNGRLCIHDRQALTRSANCPDPLPSADFR